MATVREVMSTNIVAVAPTTSIAEAATLMAEKRVGSALVVQDRLIGIFTERDIVRALSNDFDAPSHPVSHWMTRSPVTIGPDAPVEDALDQMLTKAFRHLPVLEGEEIVGVVSMRDLTRAASES